MTTNQALTKSDVTEGQFRELALAPAKVVSDAIEAARVLKDVVSRKPRPVVINDEQYLEYEDWQTVLRFYGMTVRTRDAAPVELWGVKGFKAQADVIDRATGIVVGGAEAYCMTDEDNWKDKPLFQVASMAQTRAGSKASSNVARWVAVLAGYRGTPAEEMTGKERMGATVGADGLAKEQSRYWCKEHQTYWFLRGKMKSYAHPVDGSDKWCHMPKEESSPAPAPTVAQKPPVAPGPTQTPAPAPQATSAPPQSPPVPPQSPPVPPLDAVDAAFPRPAVNAEGRWLEFTHGRKALPGRDQPGAAAKADAGLTKMLTDWGYKPVGLEKPPQGLTEEHMSALEAMLLKAQAK